MACRLDGAKPLSEPMPEYCLFDLWNKFQWNFSRNSNIFFQKNALENVVCVIASISSRPQWVKDVLPHSLIAEKLRFTIFSTQNKDVLPSEFLNTHYCDVIMSDMTTQITGVSIVYSTVCSGADERKRQSSASLAFARGNHQWLLNSNHKGPVTRKIYLMTS